MKRILLTLLAMVAMAASYAQAPQGFTYQAAVRTADGHVVANRQVGVRIALVQGSAMGVEQYAELHTPTTDAAGLFNIVVGEGTALMNCTMADCIDWANGPWFLRSQVDPDGGQDYTLSTTQQLMSVPYALYAANAGGRDTVHIRDSVVVHIHDSVVVHIRDSVAVHYDTTAFVPDTVWATDSIEGMLPGRFSINGLEQVSFASGNLQYCPSTNSVRLAEHQYDALGSLNNNYSQSSYTGWLDLLTCNNSQTWRANWSISGGGDSAGLWRVLSKAEWEYILTQRTHADSLHTLAKVNNVPGLILLPDDWQLPAGVAMQIGAPCDTNSYTLAQWAILEAAGAVFLPAAGYAGSNVSSLGLIGEYASSTYYSTVSQSFYAVYFIVSSSYINTAYTIGNTTRISVRPVHDIPRF